MKEAKSSSKNIWWTRAWIQDGELTITKAVECTRADVMRAAEKQFGIPWQQLYRGTWMPNGRGGKYWLWPIRAVKVRISLL
jgi:hypothetical protein